MKGDLMRTIFIHLRRSIKLILIIALALLIIVGALYLLYKPMYAVKLNGEIIGYTDAKKQLEAQIEDYKKNGDGVVLASGMAEYQPETDSFVSDIFDRADKEMYADKQSLKA